jgi:hypothetical protein
VDGERLVIHQFRTGTVGLAAEADLRPQEMPDRGFWRTTLGVAGPTQRQECAVCIPPGAKLLLRDIPERIQVQLGVNTEEEVIFTQLTGDTNAYRDAVRFGNGSELLLQRLQPGQRVDVLDLSIVQERELAHSSGEHQRELTVQYRR